MSRLVRRTPSPLGIASKVSLAALIWLRFAGVAVGVKRQRLPDLVQSLAARGRAHVPEVPAVHMGRIVQRVLRVGPWQPRCLFTALVLYRFLRERGDAAQLVIGLPREPRDKDAHAWVEVEGVDVGPPPGRSGHEELARFA
jgi:hypothetical protein